MVVDRIKGNSGGEMEMSPSKRWEFRQGCLYF